ncbi:MAG: response regulator transcription factor [Caldilineaceae bacterium]|nr:response regulator transcription factor [Caldilineaceae bacterium]
MTKLFIVEDHAFFRKMLITLLDRESDFTICGEAGSGEEALKLLTTVAPDLLLVDISMPGMDGFTLLEKVKSRWPQLPCVILSGHVASVYGGQAQAVNALAYIDKARTREIVPRIRQVLAEITGSL